MSADDDTGQPQRGEPAHEIEPGMGVEASEGDLGEEDVSKPRVKEVVRDAEGNVEKIVVAKGVIFKKTLEAPVDRVEEVDAPAVAPADKPHDSPDGDTAGGAAQGAGDEHAGEHAAGDGEVRLRISKEEIEALSARGTEELAEDRERDGSAPADGAAPAGDTADGADGAEATGAEDAEGGDGAAALTGFSVRELGPGLLAGMAGNDPSAVTSYAVNGATNGYGQLWLIVLATPLYQAVQYTCAKVGRTTHQGLAELLRAHYGRRIAVPASLILIVSNTALIAADLVAIGTGLQLFTGLAWQWFVVPVAVVLWYLTVYQNFGVIKKVFLGMSLVFGAYLITGLFSGADWGAVLKGTLVPRIGLNFASISSAVALLGATVSPYTMYWQVHGEQEEKRGGTRKQQLRAASLDIAAGTLSGNLVAYAIIVCTSATLFTHHEPVSTAASAARALEPLLGPYAKYLFALGFIGAGLVAIPVLLASTSYAVAGTFGWPASLWKKPWQNEGFYLILTGALVVSLVVALLGFDPIELMFGANVLQGVLAPVLVVILLVVGNNRTLMRSQRLGWWTNAGLVLMALVMSAAAILLFYGLLTGQGR